MRRRWRVPSPSQRSHVARSGTFAIWRLLESIKPRWSLFWSPKPRAEESSRNREEEETRVHGERSTRVESRSLAPVDVAGRYSGSGSGQVTSWSRRRSAAKECLRDPRRRVESTAHDTFRRSRRSLVIRDRDTRCEASSDPTRNRLRSRRARRGQNRETRESNT